MADVVSRSDLENAKLDLKTIEDVANGAADLGGDGLVHSRLGQNIKTLGRVIDDAQQVNVSDAVAQGVLDKAGRAPLYTNLYDPARAQIGKYVNSAGGISDNAGYTASDYIPVLASTTYRFAKNVTHIAYYDYSGAFISYVAGASADTDVTTPAGTANMRFSGTNVNMPATGQMLVKTNSAIGTFKAFGYEDPATANRRRIESVIASRNVLPKVLNLFDRTRAQADTALNSAGNSYSAPTCFTRGSIAVLPGDCVVCNFSSNNLWWYNESKVALSQVTAVVDGTALTAPAGAYYVRVHLGSTDPDYLTPMLLRQATLPTSYVGFGFEDPAQASLNRTLSARLVLDEQLASDRNIFDKGLIQTDKAVSAVNGAIYTAAGWFVTPNMPVKAGDYFTANYSSNSTVFRDINGKFVSGITTQVANTPVAVPAGAHYVQFQLNPVSKAEDLHVVRGSTPTSGYKAFGGSDGWLPHQGKRLITLGDSITYNAYFLPTVLAGTGMALEYNHSQPGRAMRNALKSRAALGETPTDLVASDFDDADNVLIALGTNDYGGNRPLGTLADADGAYAGSGSFYNDTFTVLDTLLGWKPTLGVVLATPLQRFDDPHGTGVYGANPSGATLKQYRQAILDMAEMFSLQVADCYMKSGFSYKTESTYSGDGLHPNLSGSYGQGRVMAGAWNVS